MEYAMRIIISVVSKFSAHGYFIKNKLICVKLGKFLNFAPL